MSSSLSSSEAISICVCVCVFFCTYCVKVKETSCPTVAPNGKPSPVALPQALSAPNEQVHLAAKVHITVCVSHIQKHWTVFTWNASMCPNQFSVCLKWAVVAITSESLSLLSGCPIAIAGPAIQL